MISCICALHCYAFCFLVEVAPDLALLISLHEVRLSSRLEIGATWRLCINIQNVIARGARMPHGARSSHRADFRKTLLPSSR